MNLLAYSGPPAPSLGGALTAWRFDPVVLALVVGAIIGYLGGVSRARRGGGHWPARYTAAFLGFGLGSLVLVTMGWPGRYAGALFSVYATQLTVLLMVVPFLLALGRPLRLARQALPERAAARLDAVLANRAARIVTVPVVSPILLAVVPFLIYFTPLYQASLTNPVTLELVHLALLCLGLCVLIPLWESDAVGARFPYAVALLFAFIELLADAVPGIVVRLDTHVIAAGYYTALGRPWGPSLLYDQQLGGDLLWCIGEAIDVPVLALLVIAWIRSDAQDAARVDAALDAAGVDAALDAAGVDAALDAAGAGAAGAGADPTVSRDRGPVAGRTGDEDVGRPWWESDATVFGDRARLYQRRD
jgi:cytochrome c oxidase assembly factor CtaG